MDCWDCIYSKELSGSRHQCLNKCSMNHNKIFSEMDVFRMSCEDAEDQKSHDYRTMTPFQFASKYYS